MVSTSCRRSKKCDSMASTDCVTQAGEASFVVRRGISRKNNNEWYVLEVMHSYKVTEAWFGYLKP